MYPVASYFGAAIRQLRERQGWSQEILAAHADLNRSYIGELERGESLASLATIAKLAEALGLRMSELLTHAEQIAQSKNTSTNDLTPIAG